MDKKHNFDKHNNTLLLTGTIDSGVYDNVGNKIVDVKERLSQYEKTIERYIENSPFDRIVFIENSGYEFDVNKFDVLAKKSKKQFEFISGKLCKSEIKLHGKSFGDAFLIQEALQKSKLLKDADTFYKITGRIFLKNSYQICRTREKYRNEFITYTALGWCFTNIFKANKEDYLRVFGDAYLECDEVIGNDIERVFYKRLSKFKLDVGSFEVYPYFEGVMGATLRNYSGGIAERMIRNILARAHVFTFQSKSSRIIEIGMKFKYHRKETS